jgi:hypothetical protein
MILPVDRLPIVPRPRLRAADRHRLCRHRSTRSPSSAPFVALTAALAAMAMLVVGCFELEVPAPSATVSPMTTVMRPARPPNCPLEVLHSMPAADVQQLALVDTWGDESAKDTDLLRVLKRKGCEVGADAVVITSDKSQHEGDQLPGYDTKVGSDIANNAANISARKHDPTVGEVGHGGRYMSGVAIAFVKDGSSGADTTSSAGP